jgi:large subunit ribosomal protein L23
VHQRAGKVAIKNAVEKLFKVKVVAVNTINLYGKKRGAFRKAGRTAQWKKAYVKLVAGQKINLVEGML